MGNTCTYCEDLGDKVSKRIATNTNFRCPVYHSRCRWSQIESSQLEHRPAGRSYDDHKISLVRRRSKLDVGH